MSEQRYGYFRGGTAAARHKKNGSKSKKCALPSDGMTEAQWKKRNGKVMEYDLRKPVTYAEFAHFPKDIQKMYVEGLRDNYGASLTSVAEMLGIARAKAYEEITKYLGVTFPTGSRSKEKREEWREFLGDMASDTQSCNNDHGDTEQDELALSSNGNKTPMAMDRLSLSFVGVIDIAMIANSLRSILGENTKGRVEITCSM